MDRASVMITIVIWDTWVGNGCVHVIADINGKLCLMDVPIVNHNGCKG